MPKGFYERKPPKTVTTGEVYKRWTVIAPCDRRRYFVCKCECGITKEIRDDSLLSGESGSCGCFAAEQASVRGLTANKTHGLSGTKVWSTYKDMVARCYNPKLKNFKNYGGVGIEVCASWLGDNGFVNFVRDMGIPEPCDTLERISVRGNYEPANCKWESSLSIQGFNKKLKETNTSGKTGVRKSKDAWQAYIQKEGCWYNLGRFTNFEDAVAARRAGELLHYGFYQEDVYGD